MQQPLRSAQTAIVAGLATAALLALGAPPATAGPTVVDEARGFKLTLPDGFTERKDLRRVFQNAEYVFGLGDPNEAMPDIVVGINELGGTISPARLQRKHMPANFSGQILSLSWHGIDIDVVEQTQRVLATVDVRSYSAQIPLRRGAITVTVTGPADRDLQPLLAQVLDGLHGETNWFPGMPRGTAEMVGYFIGQLICAGAPMAVIVILVFRFARRGTVLALGFAAWVVSFAFATSVAALASRWLALGVGVLRMGGVVLIILGLIDLGRRRKAPPSAAGRPPGPYPEAH